MQPFADGAGGYPEIRRIPDSTQAREHAITQFTNRPSIHPYATITLRMVQSTPMSSPMPELVYTLTVYFPETSATYASAFVPSGPRSAPAIEKMCVPVSYVAPVTVMNFICAIRHNFRCGPSASCLSTVAAGPGCFPFSRPLGQVRTGN